jgi:hypothetical protein
MSPFAFLGPNRLGANASKPGPLPVKKIQENPEPVPQRDFLKTDKRSRSPRGGAIRPGGFFLKITPTENGEDSLTGRPTLIEGA